MWFGFFSSAALRSSPWRRRGNASSSSSAKTSDIRTSIGRGTRPPEPCQAAKGVISTHRAIVHAVMTWEFILLGRVLMEVPDQVFERMEDITKALIANEAVRRMG